MPDAPDFTAAPSALGYLYQIRYALVLLLQAYDPDSEISIEKLDDIAFEKKGTPAELLQTKHRISHTASLSDSSTDLWKTLRIWAAGARDGTIDLASIILSLVTTATAPLGSAAAQLRPDTHRNEEEALSKLLAAGKASKSDIVKGGYAALTALAGEQQQDLIHRIRVLDAAPNIGKARELLEARLRFNTRPQFLGALCDRLEGWWFNAAVEHLRDPKAIPSISQHLVQVHLNDLNDQFRLDNLPNDFPNELDMDISELPEDERLFVEQLKYVLVSNERIKMAISDYYRAFQQRSKWVREDLLVDRDLDQYGERLIREWEELFHSMKEQLKEGDEGAVAGRELYNSVIGLVGHRIQIRPSFVEPFLMRGSYHILANSLKVGWHPDFKERFAQALEAAVRSVT